MVSRPAVTSVVSAFSGCDGSLLSEEFMRPLLSNDFLPLPRLAALVTRRPAQRPVSPGQIERLERLVALAPRVAYPLVRTGCLTRGVTLFWFLRRAGLERMQIPLRAYGAFLLVPGGIPRRPLPIAKAVARPLYNRFSRNNLYAWFRKPEAA